MKGYDYASAGGYFVTVCVDGREPVLGEVVDEEMRLSEWGRVVDDFWSHLPAHFPNVSVDMHVTMPNHVHAIVAIHDPVEEGGGTPPLRNECGDVIATPSGEPSRNEYGRGAVAAPDSGTSENGGAQEGGGTPPLQNGHGRGAVSAPTETDTTITVPTLGQIVAFYKFQTTKIINQMRDAPAGRFWQRNFYDTIIRNRRQLDALRKYIDQNPAQWALDTENPERPASGHGANSRP